MISRHDIQRLLHQEREGPVLSVFLDMSVDSDNKRTYDVFLQKRKGEFAELDSDREGHHREALGEAFARVEAWLENEFDDSKKGVALYTGIGPDWLEALQFPVPVRNRIEISARPIIGPLVQIVEAYRHHGIVLVDREHLRILSVYLNETVAEHRVETEPYPAPHDVKVGGYSAKDYQRRKAEEVRHFFKEFAREVAEFDRRYRPDDLIVLGTNENAKHFVEFLPKNLQEKVVHTGSAPAVADAVEPAVILERLEPFFRQQLEQKANRAVQILGERVSQSHLAIAGFQDTLRQLQEGRLDTLVLARDAAMAGAHCMQCGFYLVESDSACPYCGGDLERDVDLAEVVIRLAQEQDVPIEFVDSDAIADMDGVGGLLRF